jgi:hypothetical protein
MVEMGVLAMDDFGKIGFQHQWQPYRRVWSTGLKAPAVKS